MSRKDQAISRSSCPRVTTLAVSDLAAQKTPGDVLHCLLSIAAVVQRLRVERQQPALSGPSVRSVLIAAY